MKKIASLLALFLIVHSANAQNPFEQLRRLMESVEKAAQPANEPSPTPPAAAPAKSDVPATSQQANWQSAATPGKPTCAEALAFAADRDPNYLELAKTSLFGKPLLEYSSSELITISQLQCDFGGGKDAISRWTMYRQKMDKLQALHPRLIEQRAQTAPIDRPSSVPGNPSCSDLVAFGAVREMMSQEEAQKSLFGKPLLEYSKADLMAIREKAFGCEKYASRTERDHLSFAMHRMDGLRDMHERLLAQRLRNEQAAKEAKREEIERQQLKSGQRKVASIRDAAILHDPKNLGEIMSKPLLRPDGELYGAQVVLDGEQAANLLRGRASTLIGPKQTWYVFMKLTNKTVVFSPSSLRIGGEIGVIGKYVGNQKYKTVGGEERTAPIIELTHIGEVPN